MSSKDCELNLDFQYQHDRFHCQDWSLLSDIVLEWSKRMEGHSFFILLSDKNYNNFLLNKMTLISDNSRVYSNNKDFFNLKNNCQLYKSN